MSYIVPHDPNWDVRFFLNNGNSSFSFAAYAFRPIGNWSSLVAPSCSKPNVQTPKSVPFVYLQNVWTTDFPMVHE